MGWDEYFVLKAIPSICRIKSGADDPASIRHSGAYFARPPGGGAMR